MVSRGTANLIVRIGMIALLSVSLMISGCVPAGYTNQHNNAGPTKPGLYGLTGWNGGIPDINAEVGHPYTVYGPRANCVPSRNWNGNARIVSGQLPPGMEFNYQDMSIGGIPTERGHWIVKVELSNIICGGNSYQGLTQDLRFHVTGSGKVVE
jgi:hypothetical protein